jgi:hypothetical protein
MHSHNIKEEELCLSINFVSRPELKAHDWKVEMIGNKDKNVPGSFKS